MYLQMLFLLTLHNRRGSNRCKILRVDGSVVIGKAAHSPTQQVAVIRLKNKNKIIYFLQKNNQILAERYKQS